VAENQFFNKTLGVMRSRNNFLGSPCKNTTVTAFVFTSQTNPQISSSLQLGMKRKTDCGCETVDGNGQPEAKKRAVSNEKITDRFRDGLLDHATLEEYKKRYASAEP
jgi:hypothetical protein